MNKSLFSALVAAGLVASSAAFAQTPAATPAVPAASKVSIPTGVFYKGQGPQQYFAKDRLIGANVVNKDGAVIGDIEDVILNTSNEIEGVLIGTGGMLGVGEKKIGVRYSALVFEKKDGKTIIKLPAASKDVLTALEPYKRAEKKSLLDKAKERAQGLTERTKEGAGPALEKAKEVGKAAIDKTKEVGKAAVEKGKDVIDAAKEKAAPQKQ
jgi:sporulation protein YlmC with PRC-barrel domain